MKAATMCAGIVMGLVVSAGAAWGDFDNDGRPEIATAAAARHAGDAIHRGVVALSGSVKAP